MSDDLEIIQKAICIVTTPTNTGTGYLMRPNRVVTSSHVVKDATAVRVSFGNVEYEASIERTDATFDCAVLLLSQNMSEIPPLRAAREVATASDWLSFGYPAIARGSGVVIEGVIRNPRARDPRGATALQLFSADAAAGKGARLQGFSGSPVLVRGSVIGHLNWVIPDETGAAELGVVYACPIDQIETLLPPEPASRPLVPQPPSAAFDVVWYIHRELPEKMLLNCLATAGSAGVVWGPERMGKTTLLKWVLHHTKQDDLQLGDPSQVAEINLATFPRDDFGSIDRLLRRFGSRMIQSTQGLDQWLEAAWDRPGDPLSKIDWLLQERLIPSTSGRFVLSIDSADVLHDCECLDDFFAVLRGWTEDANNPRLSRLRLLLAISTTPTLLSNRISQSPFFAAATIVRLEDFTKAEVSRLAGLYGLEPSEKELDDLIGLVGGHPFLVRVAMFSAAIRGVRLGDVLANDGDTVFGDFLARLYDRVTAREGGELQTSLLTALTDILSQPPSGPPKRIPIDTAQQLLNAGIICRKGTGYSIRYNLYERFLRSVL